MGMTASATSVWKPKLGGLTFDAEGQEGGAYHSRKLHYPGGASGVTLGRGYDLKMRTAAGVVKDLTAAGLDSATANKIAKGATLSGATAATFKDSAEVSGIEISSEAQVKLFDIAYKEKADDTRRLATKADVTEKYGMTDWAALHPAIREMLVDLNFRGDYAGATRTFLQASVVRNDLPAFAALISDSTRWKGVPPDRFNRRSKFIQEALAVWRKANPVTAPGAALPKAGMAAITKLPPLGHH